jgi:hypothetical protein
MNDTPTPRTDEEAVYLLDHTMNEVAAVPADFARQLERELASLTEDIGKCHDAIGEDRASDTSELWKFFETHKQVIHRLQQREDELEQERQDRKQADLDTIRALGERNDARAEIAAGARGAQMIADMLSDERALADRLAAWLDTVLAGYDDAKEIAPFEHTEAHAANRALAAWKAARDPNGSTEKPYNPIPSADEIDAHLDELAARSERDWKPLEGDAE